MELITAPENTDKFKHISIFLAGGISNCPDWQKQAIEALKDLDLTIINPRRWVWPSCFDADLESERQIEWEHQMLKRTSAILFWFPSDTLCPITLYELGTWMAKRSKPVFVGVDPAYKRKLDVEVQTRLEWPGRNYTNSFLELMLMVRTWVQPFTLKEIAR